MNGDLQELVNVLTERAKRQVPRPKVVGALVLAAKQLPPEVVEALFPAYERRAERHAPEIAPGDDESLG